MTARKNLYRLTTALAAGGLILSPQQAGWAQLYTPGPAISGTTAAPESQTGDPPALVGRLALIQGTVSFHTEDEDHWEPATLNYPVTNGNAFWTEPAALARIEVGASAVWMGGGTEFDVNHLDLRALQATQPQGELYLHLRALGSGDTVVVQTPRGAVTMASNGRYEIAAGDSDHPTNVTVLDGSAQVSGPNLSLQVRANQTALITGTDTFQGSIGPASQDPFLVAMLQRERPIPTQAAAPPAVAQMTGCEDLGQYGAWQTAAQYGEVWYPQVSADWVPYREGHWAYVAPWGWTWVDNEPWGFAPFHYGRWVEIDHRWGWTPMAGHDPYAAVYAPALVTFFGVGAAAIGVGAALSHGNVGWVPLGPREPYDPPYHASERYLRAVNGPGVVNITNIRQSYSTMTINNFANRAGATVVPGEAMAASRPISPLAHAVPAAEFAQARPIAGRPVMAPIAATAGVTPAVAREQRFAAPPPRPAPGPAVNPAVFRAVPGRPGAAPPLRRAAEGGPASAPAAAPAAPPAPGAERPGEPRPGPVPGAATGLPPLRPAGAPEARPNGGAPGPALHPAEPGVRPAGEPALPRVVTPERAPEPKRPEVPAAAAPARPAEPPPPRAAAPERPPEVQRPAEAPREPAPAPRPAEPERRAAPPPPRPEPPRPEPPRPEPPRPEPPRPEPPRAAPAAPRPEPPRAAPPPRPEPPHPAPPQKRPPEEQKP